MDKFEQWIKGLWTNWLTTLLPLLTSINGIFAFFFFPPSEGGISDNGSFWMKK